MAERVQNAAKRSFAADRCCAGFLFPSHYCHSVPSFCCTKSALRIKQVLRLLSKASREQIFLLIFFLCVPLSFEAGATQRVFIGWVCETGKTYKTSTKKFLPQPKKHINRDPNNATISLCLVETTVHSFAYPLCQRAMLFRTQSSIVDQICDALKNTD